MPEMFRRQRKNKILKHYGITSSLNFDVFIKNIIVIESLLKMRRDFVNNNEK